MKLSFLISLLSMLSFVLFSQRGLEGTWQTGEDNTVIETYQKDGMWYGKIISSDHPNAKIGKDILRDFQLKDGLWKGKLYAAKRDKILDTAIIPSTDNLDIEVFAGFFSKKLSWKRIES